MDARTILVRLRNGDPLDQDALRWFARGLADGAVSDAQAGAFAMAALIKGLGDAGRTGLTLAMRDSGDVLTWDMDAPVVDKHSTGGVGDCVSLILAPALAACGVYVPMISGRGLGHTGGTLDKIESIPGVRTDLTEAQFRRVVGEAGCAIVSASGDIAPADKRLYAVRDVTGTVESLDLITASILSKKLAAGLEGLVLDVKTGSGAFMKTAEDARALACALVETANAAGCKTSALISDMSQPLAPACGNALEVAACMEVLCDGAGGPLRELTCVLGGVALASCGVSADVEAGTEAMARALSSGRAAEHWGRMIAVMGGPRGFTDQWRRFLPEAPVIREVKAARAGYVAAMDGEAMGLTVVALGGGRQVETDLVDPAVGVSDIVPLGTRVEAGQVIMRIHAARTGAAQAAEAALHKAVCLSDEAPDLPPLIHERIG